MSTYAGYLAPYVERIRELYGQGRSTREIAATLFELGARAYSTDLKLKMSREHHVQNLRAMVLHVLKTLGLPRHRKHPALFDHDVENAAWRAFVIEDKTKSEIARGLGVSRNSAVDCIWRGGMRLRRQGLTDEQLCEVLKIEHSELLRRARAILGPDELARRRAAAEKAAP